VGKKLSVEEMRSLLLRLRDTGVHNINLVTPTHHSRFLAEVLTGLDLGIPVVWNSSGYESVETLQMLEGLVQVYMPDMKYMDADLAKAYSAAADYPEVAAAAIREMFRQRGEIQMDDDGMLTSGVLIRHLILPGQEENAMNVIDFVADSFPEGSVLFSLMGQYTPMQGTGRFPELQRRVSEESVNNLCHYMKTRKLENGYWQEVSSATEEMIPLFDGTGV
jgi:putative pyruvate formate lyase activating enzyme